LKLIVNVFVEAELNGLYRPSRVRDIGDDIFGGVRETLDLEPFFATYSASTSGSNIEPVSATSMSTVCI
jgi:hypothetical protein